VNLTTWYKPFKKRLLKESIAIPNLIQLIRLDISYPFSNVDLHISHTRRQ